MEELMLCEDCREAWGIEQFKYRGTVSWAGKCGICGYQPRRKEGEEPKLSFIYIPETILMRMMLREMTRAKKAERKAAEE